MVEARLYGAEKRANTRPSMMKLTSELAMTCAGKERACACVCVCVLARSHEARRMERGSES